MDTKISETVKVVLQSIKNLRIERKYTLAEVAKNIGYESVKGYRDLETGKTDIKLEHLIKLSYFYRVPMDFFLNPRCTKSVHNENDDSVA